MGIYIRMKKAILLFTVFFAFPLFVSSQSNDEKLNDIVKIPASPVKNQQKTGTCWSFATVSFLESEILRKGKGEYDLSEMFFVRYAYLQKAKNYLLYHGKTNFSEGGQAHDVINIIKYSGIVPEPEYTGKTDASGVLDHNKLEEELEKYISKTNDGFNEKKADTWEEKYVQILDNNLGQIPAEFGIKGQIYSPKTFTDFLAINPDDYIEFTSYSHHPFYASVDLEIPDNWSHDTYINVPIDELVAIVDSSLYNGYSVCWDGDTSEKGFNHRAGFAKLEDGTETDQINRQKTFYNRKTTDDHLMHIIGISENSGGEKFYLVKNSWGTDKSKFDGLLYMSIPYLRLKTIAIMVHKNAVPKPIMRSIQ